MADTIPASPSSQQPAGPDINELIKAISTPLPSELIRSAATPMVGPHAVALPSSLTTPIAVPQPGQLDKTPVVGAGNARAQGIGNAVIGSTNALAAVITAERQHKQGQVRDAATKVIMAQQAIDEAKQVHDQAASSGDTEAAAKAQELIDQNTKVRDGVFADPRMRKALQKGFNISYTDPQSNKTEEHVAVQQAMKQAKTIQEKRQIARDAAAKQNAASGAAMGEAFAKQQPLSMAPNRIAQLQLQLAQDQKKNLTDLYKAVAPAMARADASVRVENMRSMTELLKQQNATAQRTFERNQAFQQRLQLLEEQQRFAMQRLQTQNAMMMAREQQRLQNAATDPATVMRLSDESARTWASAIASQQTQLDSAIHNLEADRKNAASPQTIQQEQAEVEARQTALDNAKDQASYYQNFYNAKRQMLGMGSSLASLDGDSNATGTNSTDKSSGTNTNPSGSSSVVKPSDRNAGNPNSLSGWASGQNDGWDLNAVP